MTVSIDIGTSYSSICILGPDGKAQPVDVSTGISMFGSKDSMPSAVYVDDGGEILVGQAAMNSRKYKPGNFRMEFKRNLGEDIPILLGERSFRVEDLYTELFRHMKARAEEVTRESIEKAYLTCPASYGENRRERLCAAAKAAGLFDLELVDEPIAAAMSYCAQGYVKDGQSLLIYDFGGGTFDAALLRYENEEFQLLSEPVGLERCGGMDIDTFIAQDMRETVEKKFTEIWASLQKNQKYFMRFTSQLNELAVKAKHQMSVAGSFQEYIEVGMDGVDYLLTREKFEQMISSLVGQTIQLCRQLLKDAQISGSDLSAVILAGGTSQIPLVQEMAGKIIGKPPLHVAGLELAVAQGALMYQQYCYNEKKRKVCIDIFMQIKFTISGLFGTKKFELKKITMDTRFDNIFTKNWRGKIFVVENVGDAFGIWINDEEAGKIVTIGDAVELIYDKINNDKIKEDENLMLGQYVEEFITNCKYIKKEYIKKGIGFSESVILSAWERLVREFVIENEFLYEVYIRNEKVDKCNMDALKKRCIPDRNKEKLLFEFAKTIGRFPCGTALTNKGIYWCIYPPKYTFVSWKRFKNSILTIDDVKYEKENIDDLVPGLFGKYLSWQASRELKKSGLIGPLVIGVSIQNTAVALFDLGYTSEKDKEAIQKFLPDLQEFLHSKR